MQHVKWACDVACEMSRNLAYDPTCMWHMVRYVHVMTHDMVQGDKERELGMPISPLMDRAHQGGMTRSQVLHPFFFLHA